jgi:squalene-hopene/tetraprenyl-beta-curcumene cyclase
MGLQQDDGWWRCELETQVTMDAEDLLLREFLRIRGAADTEEAAHCIRSQQRDDGTWATFYGGPRSCPIGTDRSCGSHPDPRRILSLPFVS